jgi:hypothetical protein
MPCSQVKVPTFQRSTFLLSSWPKNMHIPLCFSFIASSAHSSVLKMAAIRSSELHYITSHPAVSSQFAFTLQCNLCRLNLGKRRDEFQSNIKLSSCFICASSLNSRVSHLIFSATAGMKGNSHLKDKDIRS